MKKVLYEKKKILLFFLHIIVLGVVGLAFLRYAEEVAEMKGLIRQRIRYEREETNVDFSDYPAIAQSENAWYKNEPLIYHAGGGIEGRSYTNSKEALEQTLNRGQRFVEMDFLYTSDGQLACAHYWNSLYDDDITIPTLEEFKEHKIFGKYTTLTAEQLIAYMEQYKDLHIIIDTKEENYKQVIADLVKLSAYDSSITERFIIQLYEAGTKQQFQKMFPFKDENFLFTTYKYGTEYTNKLMKICYEENVAVITIPYGMWDADTIEMFTEKGFVIYEHTVNRVNRAKWSLDKGIRGFYTDYLTEEELEN